MAAPPPAPGCMSVAAFLEWEPGDGRTWQLVDGVPHQVPVAPVVHGALLAEVAAIVGNHLHQGARLDPGLSGPGSAAKATSHVIAGLDPAIHGVPQAPSVAMTRVAVVPRVRASHNMRIADLIVTRARHGTDEIAVRDPLLVIEVLMPDNDRETWPNVWAYATIPSVTEIVVLHTASVGADVIRREATGAWARNPERVTGGDLVLDSIGLRTPLAELYRTTRLGRHEPEAP